MKTFDGLTPDQLKLRKKNSEILGIVFIILGFILLVVPLLGIGAIGFGVYQVVMSSKYHIVRTGEVIKSWCHIC